MAFVSYSSTATACGPSIPLQDLTILYDFSNTKTYPGSGNTVYDLSGNGLNAVLSGSGASRPTLVSDGGKSYLSFVSASEHYMYCNIPLAFGPSFTSIAVVACPTSTWDNNGGMASIRWSSVGSSTEGTNGFIMDFPYIIGSAPHSAECAIEYKNSPPPINSSFSYSYVAGATFITPSDKTLPNLYCYGYDHNTGYVMSGYNSSITDITSTTPLTGREAKTNSRLYFAQIDERFSLKRFTSMKCYLYLLYNRKLSTGEIRGLYDSIRTRFGV